MASLRPILDKHSLNLRSVLKETDQAGVYLVVDSEERRCILKTRSAEGKRREIGIERRFLEHCASLPLQHLETPTLLAAGDNYLLMSFVDREAWTRDTIEEHSWTRAEVDLWVQGLREFQAIEVPPGWFSLRRRLLGTAYAMVACVRNRAVYVPCLNRKERGTLARVLGRYLLATIGQTRVLTHYDLQTHNYSFSRGRNRMSILDFELAYYKGDPLWDLLYYCTIPVTRLADWSFQGLLLRTYLERPAEVSAAVGSRIRLILLACNVLRCKFFRDDGNVRRVYESNLHDLLHDLRFDRWLASTLGTGD